jgi:hypothetical protein
MRRRACFSLLFLLGIIACNPSVFDGATDKAPVGAIGKPNGFRADSLGFVVVPLPPPVGAFSPSARLFFSGTDAQALGVADFDKDGRVTTWVASDTELSELGNGNAGIVASAALRPDGVLVLGTPRFGQLLPELMPHGRVSFLTLTTAADGKVTFAIKAGPEGNSHFGISVGVGNVTGTDANESVGVADETVTLMGANQKPIHTAHCQDLKLYNPTDPYAHRPIVVGNFLTGGADEIVVAGQTNGQGKVVLLSFDTQNNTLTCPAKVLLPTTGHSGQYAASLAAADFNGDGTMDLAVGNPSDRVYVYFGPLDTKLNPDLVVTGEAGSDFGRQISSIGSGVADLIVSAPSATVDQRLQVGKVYRLRVSDKVGTLSHTAALVTLSPEGVKEGEAFGTSTGGLFWNNRTTCQMGGNETELLWASTKDTIFTFFRYAGSVPDPRCLMQKK